MYHIFSIHSSVEGHQGSFQILARINAAAMNRGSTQHIQKSPAQLGFPNVTTLASNLCPSNLARRNIIMTTINHLPSFGAGLLGLVDWSFCF